MVRTYYFNKAIDNALPGREIVNPPQEQTFNAHNNVFNVKRFFRDVLEHSLEDEETEVYISSIMCVEDPHPNYQEDNCAYWHDRLEQAFFGQCFIQNGELRSLAIAQDIVAHEFGHGLTSWTAKLVYRDESGALDESFADIFAILVANYNILNIGMWNWEIGRGFGQNGQAIRDLSSPPRYGHPEHMNNYQYLVHDRGGVHFNCGIHNKAAYNLLTSQDNEDNYLFDPESAAVLFYKALTQLGETSSFSDSRRAIQEVGKTLFRNNPNMDEKLQAIATAFDEVGIFLE
ncbi:M4 family peptidase [Hassallia byssoidea VB512170]|uniref:Neutral metalloproteinase n=1 Tax=Hassallia byssoidea VB512170 TaxID=1304833 RepID=A0A846HGR5_9CYAN|nr:M4 family metallopeptidase [Hassalia byssoidea]NEU76148.1 M4 family peptidase [Hassalia byssoidea VB512170]